MGAAAMWMAWIAIHLFSFIPKRLFALMLGFSM
jgi:hypothetical protein